MLSVLSLHWGLELRACAREVKLSDNQSLCDMKGNMKC